MLFVIFFMFIIIIVQEIEISELTLRKIKNSSCRCRNHSKTKSLTRIAKTVKKIRNTSSDSKVVHPTSWKGLKMLPRNSKILVKQYDKCL